MFEPDFRTVGTLGSAKGPYFTSCLQIQGRSHGGIDAWAGVGIQWPRPRPRPRASIAINDEFPGYYKYQLIISEKGGVSQIILHQVVQLGSVFLLKKINDFIFINYYLDNKLLLSSINFYPWKTPTAAKKYGTLWLVPLSSNSHLFIITSFLVGDPYKTFICHRYWEGGQPKVHYVFQV